ncbi:hypothetical protein BY996DRAFT_6416180 [Phakopsora pachyrhizi]|uniref:Expressed protein n=1 Tax=Phakopsora pachyrhizi TaxID=170000 RepID=A0AAV0BX34_PHAPC|nr:hypothetical protein BY996DRAFT_6416180 [Phakopsora pachyrhizi]CAH7690840.1 expressed protein [Phakopsora pachyrhizi]
MAKSYPRRSLSPRQVTSDSLPDKATTDKSTPSKALSGSTTPTTPTDPVPSVGDTDSAAASRSENTQTTTAPSHGATSDNSSKKQGSSSDPDEPPSSFASAPLFNPVTEPSSTSNHPNPPSPPPGIQNIVGDPFNISTPTTNNRSPPSSPVTSAPNKPTAPPTPSKISVNSVATASIPDQSFNTAQAPSAVNGASHAIYSPAPAGSLSTQSKPQDDTTGTSVGTVMGILVGAVIGAVILIGMIRMIAKRIRKSKSNSDYNNNPFDVERNYGDDQDMMTLRSDDSKGPMINAAAQTNALNRSTTAVSRGGGAYGPRPPTVIQRHFAAPTMPPAIPSYQPGQAVNYNNQPNQVYNSHQQPSSLHPYPINPNAAYASTAIAPSQGHWNGFDAYPDSSQYEKKDLSLPYHHPSIAAQGSHLEEEYRPSGYAQAVTYQHQVQQLDFGPPLSVKPGLNLGSLKNPYDSPSSGTGDTNQSGTPTNPNVQQSYFDSGNTNTPGSGNNTKVLVNNSASKNDKTLEVQDLYQGLSVRNGTEVPDP